MWAVHWLYWLSSASLLCQSDFIMSSEGILELLRVNLNKNLELNDKQEKESCSIIFVRDG